MAFPDKHVVAYADHLRQERDHVGRLAHGLAVGDLGLGLVEIHQRQTQQAGGAGKREAGPGRLVPKQRDRQPSPEESGIDVAAPQLLEDLRGQQKRLEIAIGQLPGQQRILAVESRIGLGQLFDQGADGLCHIYSS